MKIASRARAALWRLALATVIATAFFPTALLGQG